MRWSSRFFGYGASERLERYAAGELTADEVCAVEAWLAEDADARSMLDEIKAAQQALSLLDERMAPPVEDVLPTIQAAIREQSFTAKPKLYLESQGSRFYRRLAVAATIVGATGVGVLALRGNSTPTAPEQSTPGVYPSAIERGLEPLVEAGSAGALAGDLLLEMAEKNAVDLDHSSYAPGRDVIPVTSSVVERR